MSDPCGTQDRSGVVAFDIIPFILTYCVLLCKSEIRAIALPLIPRERTK